MNTRERILQALKIGGPITSQELAKQLGVTSMAIKLQLYELEAQGIVGSTIAKPSRGRPSKVWGLAEKSAALFPDSHAALVHDVLVSIRRSLGASALEKVLGERAAEQFKRYEGELSKCTNVMEKVQSLAVLRSLEGYMATVEFTDGRVHLIENHCPICSAAKECVQLCSGELEIFQKLFATECTVSRIEHIISGARRCVYEFAPFSQK